MILLRHTLRSMAAIVMLVSTIVVATPSTTVAATTVSGTITNVDGDPVGAVIVFCNDVEGCLQTNNYSGPNVNPDGGYTIALPDAEWTVSFSAVPALDYEDEWYSNRYDPDLADTFDTSAGGAFTLDAVIERRAVASGTLLDELGVGAPSIWVDFCPTDGVLFCRSIQTDVDGTFSIPLPPDTYSLEYRVPPTEYLPLFWDNQRSEDDADEIVIVPATTPVFDAQMTLRATISGTVRDQFGVAVPDIRVSFFREDGSSAGSILTGADGTFSRIVPDDRYLVRFSPAYTTSHIIEWWEDEPTDATATVLDTNGNVSHELDVTIERRSSIVGNVTDDVTTDPVQGVRVTLCAAGGSPCTSNTTDADGNYDIFWDDGSYTLRFSKTDGSYESEYWDDQPDTASADPVVLAAGGTTVADASLFPLTPISGTVTAEAGGLVDVTVFACKVGGSCHTGFGAGAYTVWVPETGDYIIRFLPSPVFDLQEEYYDDAIAESNATPVSVVAGTPVTGIDAVLGSEGSVIGTITDDSGAPIEGLGAALCPVPSGGCSASGVTDENGLYAIRASAGDYRLVFDGRPTYEREYYNDTPSSDDAQIITITPGENQFGFDAVLRRLTTISGTVTDASSADGIAGVSVSANSVIEGFGGAATTDTDGNYTITGLPPADDYTVSFNAATHFRDDYPTPVATTFDAPATGIDIALAAGGAITGRVVDPLGSPIENVQVNADGPTSSIDYTAADGTFTVSPVAAGVYELRFVDFLGGRPTIELANIEVSGISTTSVGDIVMGPPGAISGVVTSNGVAVEGITVEACSAQFVCNQAISGPDGTYQIGDLAPADYTVEFARPNSDYAIEFWPGVYEVDDATPVSVAVDATTPNINADLVIGGAIAGQLYRLDGTTPVFPAEVSLYACSESLGACTVTNTVFDPSAGAYRFQRLPPADDYTVEYRSNNSLKTQWWCDADSAADAVLIAVTAGETTDGIDELLGPVGETDTDDCDLDDDSVRDPLDNCPADANPDQTDLDNDGTGDACDPDNDGDGVDNASDNCPADANPDQADLDNDGTGDACDPVNDNAAFASLEPARYADSRDASTFDGQFLNTGPRASGTHWEIDIAGRGGVPNDANAAIVNVTLLNGTGPGFATVYPCGPLPTASSVNYTAGSTEPNEVIAKLSDSGSVCVYTLTEADVIVDVVGYVDANSPYQPLDPARYADSRDQPTFDDAERDTGIRAGGTVWEIPIAGRGEVPANATTVVANVTITGGTGPGFATVYPCTDDVPEASSLNYDLGVTIPNELVTKLADDGSICVFTLTDAHVIVDVVGFLGDVPGYTPLTPARFADSRDLPTFDDAFRNTGPRPSGTTWEIDIAGRGDIPDDAVTATLNLTVTESVGPGFATVYPCTDDVPDASSLNYGVNTTRPNEVIAKLSDQGRVCVYTLTAAHVIVDITGYA